MITNAIVTTLLEATLTLYPTNPDGSPITSTPIWMGVNADYLEIADRWIKTETRPTGAKYPKKHPLVPQFEITAQRVWALPITELVGFIPTNDQFVLDIVWSDEDTGYWHRETFYGVTISDRSRGSRELDAHAGEFTERQVFDAQYMAPPTTGFDAPGPISTTLPYTAVYIATDGTTVPIYSYDPNTFAFSEVSTGISTGRATIANDGTEFSVTFAGASLPALSIESSIAQAAGFVSGSAAVNDTPRVDFMYGTTRIGSVDASGNVFAAQFIEGPPDTQRTPAFRVSLSSNLVMSLEPTGFYAQECLVFTPATISGLVLWCPIEALHGSDDGSTVSNWPDWSGSGNPLLQATLGAQPIYRSRVSQDSISGRPLPPDGKPSVFFDTAGRKMSPASGSMVNFTTGFTVFLYFWPCNDDNEEFINSVTSGGDDDFEFAVADSPEIKYSLGGTPHAAQGGSITPFNWHLFEFSVTPAGHQSFTMDGVEVIGQDGLTGNLNKQLQLGGAGLGNSLQGYARAMLVYQGTLTSQQKTQIRNYLNTLYGP